MVLGHSLDEHDDYHLDVIAGVVHCLGEGGEEVRGEGEGGGEAVGEEEACTPHLGVGGAILERRACVGGSWYGREYQELEEVGMAGSIRTGSNSPRYRPRALCRPSAETGSACLLWGGGG